MGSIADEGGLSCCDSAKGGAAGIKENEGDVV